jgi:hypothetical protein
MVTTLQCAASILLAAHYVCLAGAVLAVQFHH